jgi:cobalt-zinc-cadmium efflux system protein
VVVNLGLTLAQVLGGWVADSTALIADGVHNLSDALALLLAFGARRLARRPASPAMSYGWGRAEVVAAFVNYLALIVVSVWLAVEAVGRLVAPPEVGAGLVMGLAALALVIDTATAALVWRASRDSMNLRAAFLHNLADAGVSVAVIVGGALIWAFGWRIADPILTIAISVVILVHVLAEIGPVLRMLMLGAPADADHAAIAAGLGAIEGVAGVHHIHLWQLDERRTALSAHLVIAGDAGPAEEGRGAGGALSDPRAVAAVVRAAKAMLRSRFGVDHATLETEWQGQPCGDAGTEDAAEDAGKAAEGPPPPGVAAG